MIDRYPAGPFARAVLLIGILLMTGCAGKRQRFEYVELIMGVEARLTMYAPHEQAARVAARAAFDRMNELDAVLSDYRADSEAMRLCRTSGEAVPVSEDLYDVLHLAAEISEASGGAFDVTIGPLVQLWREVRRTGEMPPPWDLDDAKRLVDWQLIELIQEAEGTFVRLRREGMRLDFGGIGKGYAAHAALEVLRERGFDRCLVDLGGDIVAGDPPPFESAWKVQIEFNVQGKPSRVVPLVNQSIATSGYNIQSIEIDGVTYSHIIDPRTGLGLTNRTAVTVIAPDGALADALASALSVVGRTGARQLMSQFPDCRAMLEIDTGEFPLRIFLNGFPEPMESGSSSMGAKLRDSTLKIQSSRMMAMIDR